MKRILIADDHEMFRMGIRTLLDSRDDFEVVGETGTGAETLAFLQQTNVDLLLLDHSMPDGTGLDVLRELKAQGTAGMHIIMLTAIRSPLILAEAIEEGVSAIVAKRGSGQELIDAFNEVVADRQFLSADILEALARGDELGGLTRRELEVFALLLDGLSTQQIADELKVSFKTAETHKTRVMQKMDVHSTQALLAKARALGVVPEA